MYNYSFIDILTRDVEFEQKKYNFTGIRIPMIQRDYAQGRESESEIRKRFLREIFKALEAQGTLELDFVYGANKSIDDDELFVPLDGQQRLTTLYLLHWYIGNRELEDDKKDELRRILARFSYATRAVSDKFCEKLSQIPISFNETPSDEIKNASWFFDSFLFDPTVQSMLVMLDSIHSAYGSEKRNLFPGLDKIRFYFLPLDGFGLTDELYIKMNARGKQLTQFENFKADLIKWMKDEETIFYKEFHEDKTYNNRTVKYHIYFELKLDTQWTHLFWKISKNNVKQEKKLVDPYMLQFCNRYFLNSHIVFGDISQSNLENDDVFTTLYSDEGDGSKFKYSNFDIYKKLLEKVNVIKDLDKVFERLSNCIDEVNENIDPCWDKNDNWTLFSETINQRQRILFYAVTSYLETNAFDSIRFKNWIRVVWNIIIDPDIRSVPLMAGAMRFIKQLAVHSGNIYGFLRSPASLELSGNSKFQEQLEEEHFKAILIDKSEEWEALITAAESHPLFQGKIKFLLTNNEDTDIESFKIYKNTSFAILKDNDLKDRPENYLWIRALLAKSVDIPLPVTLSNGYFSNWRELINDKLINGIRLLIDDISKENKPVEQCLKEICINYQRDDSQIWVYPLVKWTGKNGETLLGNYSETRKIQHYDNNCNDPNLIYLFNKTNWTEGNIQLSYYRNEIVAALLILSSDIRHNSTWHNIQNCYFRGGEIQLERVVDSYVFTYIIDKNFVRVGVKSDPAPELKLIDTIVIDDEKESGWTCRMKFDYTKVQLEEINKFIENIENNIFERVNPDSLVNKIEIKQ